MLALPNNLCDVMFRIHLNHLLVFMLLLNVCSSFRSVTVMFKSVNSASRYNICVIYNFIFINLFCAAVVDNKWKHGDVMPGIFSR